MSFLYLLESIRNPVLDAFFSLVTLFGEETLFMAIGMIIFWCVSKYQGYFLLFTGFLGITFNQFLKILCRIPRPWVLDPNFTIVESARDAATGYSFPSGHTQTAVGLYGGIARTTDKKWLRIAMIVLALLVGLSRMYLGVHTPADVLVSLAIATVLIFVAYPLFRKAEHSPKMMYGILLAQLLVIVAYLCFVYWFPFPAEAFAEGAIQNLEHARENAFTLLGCAVGFIATYTIDRKWINFDTKAVWWAQILKVVGGLLLVLAVKALLKTPLDTLFSGHMIARAIRYFLMVVVGGILWPMTFRYFAKFDKKEV